MSEPSFEQVSKTVEERRKVQLIEADLLDDTSFYKHSKTKITNIIKQIIL